MVSVYLLLTYPWLSMLSSLALSSATEPSPSICVPLFVQLQDGQPESNTVASTMGG